MRKPISSWNHGAESKVDTTSVKTLTTHLDGDMKAAKLSFGFSSGVASLFGVFGTNFRDTQSHNLRPSPLQYKASRPITSTCKNEQQKSLASGDRFTSNIITAGKLQI